MKIEKTLVFLSVGDDMGKQLEGARKGQKWMERDRGAGSNENYIAERYLHTRQ